MEPIHRGHCRHVAFSLRIMRHGLVLSCMCIEMRLIWWSIWRLVLRVESILRGLRAHLLRSI
jgi:hypothetical protein